MCQGSSWMVQPKCPKHMPEAWVSATGFVEDVEILRGALSPSGKLQSQPTTGWAGQGSQAWSLIPHWTLPHWGLGQHLAWSRAAAEKCMPLTPEPPGQGLLCSQEDPCPVLVHPRMEGRQGTSGLPCSHSSTKAGRWQDPSQPGLHSRGPTSK